MYEPPHKPSKDQIILHGTWFEEGTDSLRRGSLGIADRRIATIGDRWNYNACVSSGVPEIDLSGLMLMRGLVNAHDHLQYALHPRIGRPPYKNYIDWGDDIHQCCVDAIAQPKLVPRTLRLLWGGVRNLLCGVTTVCHHDQLWPALLDPRFPIKVVRRYGWAHSVALVHDLHKSRAMTPAGCPFIIHAGEGLDELTCREVYDLDRFGILDEQTVVVHGLAFDENGTALMRKRRASLILCPSSNSFLFGRVPGTHLICGIESVALGNDSPITAAGDLLDEAQFAIEYVGIAPDDVFRMITSVPTNILHLRGPQGIEVNSSADLIAIPDTGEIPASRLRTLSWKDVEFVLVDGTVQLVSNDVWSRLPSEVRAGLEPLVIDGVVRWLRVPARELVRSSEAALGRGAVRLGGRTVTTFEDHRTGNEVRFSSSQQPWSRATS